MIEEEQGTGEQTNQIQGATIDTWLTRFRASEKYMKQEFFPKYQVARLRLRSEYEVETVKKGYKTHKQVNLTYSIGSNFVNSVAPKNIDVNFTARNEEDRVNVENAEIKVNEFFKDKKVKRTVKRIVWDTYNGGFGARFMDYEYEAQDDPNQPIIDPTTGQQTAFKQAVLKNRFVLHRVRPELVRFPKGFDFDNYQESPWIGFDVFVPVSELGNYPQFDVNATQKIKGKQYDDLMEVKSFKDSNSDLLFAKLHYCLTKEGGEDGIVKLVVFNEESKDLPLQAVTEFEKGQKGYPIKFLYFNPLDDDCPYPFGDPWVCESQFAGIDHWWKTYVNRVKRNNPKNILDKGKIKNYPQTLQQLKRNEDMEYVGIETKDGTPTANVMTPYEQPKVPEDVSIFYDQSRALLNELAPKSSQSLGQEASKDQKVGVAQIIQANELIDIESRQDDIKEFILDIALDLAGMYEKSFQGMTEAQGKLSNGEEVDRENLTNENFSTNFEADCEIQTIKPLSRDIARRQMLELIAQLQTIQPELNKIGKSFNFEPLIENIVDGIGVRGADKLVVDLNIRNPNKEHEEAVFHGMPLEVQSGEDKKAHLLEHYGTYNDAKRMAVYEATKPGFTQELEGHILDTHKQIQAEQATLPKQSTKQAPISDRTTGVMA